MSIKSIVLDQLHEIAREHERTLPDLTDDLVLLDSGLDSLAMAILVAKLEDALGFDPFNEAAAVAYPVTLGDFIALYEGRAGAFPVDSARP
jgi:acyl carrier protein